MGRNGTQWDGNQKNLSRGAPGGLSSAVFLGMIVKGDFQSVEWQNAMTAEAEIRRRIVERGPITFADFMEMALYHPGGGYYTAGGRVGAAGDFYTSPSAHPAFGALLAVQLFQMWQLLGQPTPFTVAEPGAGNGLLCRDIVGAAAGLPDGFVHNLRYVCLDRRASTGYERGLAGVSRVASAGLPLRGMVGCVLSNELLDAMPVHQVKVEGGHLREVYVALDGDGFAAQSGQPSTPLLAQRLAGLGVELSEGQTAEVNLSLESWTEAAALAMERGFVLTVDYGRPAEELYSPEERFRGTLTTFRHHLQTDRPLERVGQQDMSAQVDFTALAKAGAQAGLDLWGYTSQGIFLRNLGLGQLESRSPIGSPRQSQASRAGMRELAKPGGLGDFKVMAQGKNVEKLELWGFSPSEQAQDMAALMPPPIPAAGHLDLLAGRYPAMEVEFEMAWDALWLGDSPSP